MANPLDTTKYRADPCHTFAPTQLQSIGLPNAAPKPDPAFPTGPTCFWYSSPGGFGIAAGFLTANKHGLNDLYDKKNDVPLFQELPPINGYPAIIYADADLRSQGVCGIDIGVSDVLVLDVRVQGTFQTKDPCGIAQRAAGFAVDNIKGGA